MKIIYLVTILSENIPDKYYFLDLKLAQNFLYTLSQKSGTQIHAFIGKRILYDSVEEALDTFEETQGKFNIYVY